MSSLRGGVDPVEGTAEPKQLAQAAASIAADKKAQDIVLVDMTGLVDYTDHFVVCTGRTPRQTRAIVDELRFRMKHDHGVSARRVEGDREGEWILVDLLDIVFHCFTPESRDFYRLDRLWREAPQERWASEPVPAAPASTIR